jgi:hypothetical protein
MRLISTVTAAVVFFTAAVPAGSQTSDAHIQELIRAAAANIGGGQAAGVTGAPTPMVQPGTGPGVALTLDEAVKLALDRNLDIAVQRLNPQINDIAIASIRSVYHPTLTSTLNRQSTTTPSTSTISGTNGAGEPINQGVNTYNAGIAQSVPWGGGGITVTANNNRQTTTSLNTLYNPVYNSNWSAAYTQPLMRGFKIDSTRRQLQVTKLTLEQRAKFNPVHEQWRRDNPRPPGMPPAPPEPVRTPEAKGRPQTAK